MEMEFYSSESGDHPKVVLPEISSVSHALDWVTGTYADFDFRDIVKYVVKDGTGPLCIWERPAGSREMPQITARSSRCNAKWPMEPDAIILP
jgi:hypothetical protein